MSILHCREAFEDDADTKRHLVRVWLNNEERNWKLPSALKLAWEGYLRIRREGSIGIGNHRGGRGSF